MIRKTPPPPDFMENGNSDNKDKNIRPRIQRFFQEYWKIVVVCVSVTALALALILTPVFIEEHNGHKDDSGNFNDPTLIESPFVVKGRFAYDGYMGDSVPLNISERLYKDSEIILNEDKSGKFLLKGEFLPKKIMKEDIRYKTYATESESHFLLILTDGSNTTKIYYVSDSEKGDYLIYEGIEFRAVKENPEAL